MRKLTLSLAVMAALLPVRGYPLGLGDLELNSALNQELNAEIEVLSAAPEDAEQIIIKLASRDAFSRAGIDRPHLLQQLKFKIIDKNGKSYVKVYTKTPIREPFLSFLVEIDWPQGHLLREYTLLLDPPVYNSATPGATTASAGVNSPFNEPADAQAQTQPVLSEQQSAQSVQSSAQAPGVRSGVISSDDSGRSVNYNYQALPVANASSDQYRVQQNDTLWSMANRMRPDSSVSVEQMMLALVRKNPEAFIQENINGVKRGYILRIPNRDEATQIDRQQAVAQAREHSALWREYSQGAASASPASSLEAEPAGGGAGDQPRDADGHLSIVSASESGSEFAGSNQDPDASLSSLKQELAMAQEQLESERLEKEDLRARLAELEDRVQRVIEMDDGELAQLQQDLQTEKQVAEPLDAPVEDMPVDDLPAEDIVEEPVLDEVITDELPEEGLTEEVIPEEALSDETTEETTEETTGELTEDAIFVDETVSDDMVESETETQAQMLEPVDVIETPAFAQQKPKSFLEGLMEDPKLLGMVGGGLAFVLLLITLLLKRIRGGKADEEEQWTASMDDPSSDMSSLEADLNAGLDEATVKTEAAEMDSTAEMIAEPVDDDLGMEDTQIEAPDAGDNLEDTVFNLEGADQAEPEEDERDDVIAEADVYLAYGIYQQAEELLNSAIDQNPQRDDYRMKLLETHYAAKNGSAFEQLAEDLKARKGDDKAFWSRVTAMGMELCPQSQIFSGSDAIMSDFDAEALLPDKPQTTDLDLDAGDDSATDFDLGLDAVDDQATDFDLGLDSDEGLGDDSEKTQVLSEPLDLDAMSPEEESLDDGLDLAGDLDDIASELDSDLEEESPSDDTSSELEFDLGEIDDMEESTVDVEDDSTESAELDIDDDFSLDFDAADLGFEEAEDEPEETAETEEINLDADLDLGEDLTEELDSSADDSLEMDMGEIEIDGDELDLGDMDLGDDLTEDLGELDSEVSENLSSDIETDEMDIGVETLDDSVDDLSDDGEFDISELSEDVDEVSTKLDLAKAYIDMGDKDGARSILEEVKAEGNDEQQQQAEELLQQAS
ncbi:MAG: hypothetical protein DIZ80_05140 [endosymbiont of Galathealinum brachiosum]|uniref:FimV N-terminal domain-containing protein n=1 Tax=endosymbiont of Galathealinum brachiosum TaxID=2200906 RepID=A0A370DJ00_9GAMM|nr:MAG: hypothetical protein DIZ80_05140 [endosymbiont of Galathealinum brachiosum]